MSARILISLLLILIGTYSFGQSQESKDSLVNEMCKTTSLTSNLSDSARISILLKKHLRPFVSRYPENVRKEIRVGISVRLQKKCKEYEELIDRIYPTNGDLLKITDKPKTKLSKNACRQFFDFKNYSYLEHSGDTVKLQIANGYWIDHFKDGTYSKLKLEVLPNCEFEIEFIESNNHLRKNYSKQGDKFRYRLIDKTLLYFLVVVENVETGSLNEFKMYY